MNSKTNRVLEILWLVVTVLGLGAFIHKSLTSGLRESLLFLLITFIAAAMFMLRRSIRKRSGKENA